MLWNFIIKCWYAFLLFLSSKGVKSFLDDKSEIKWEIVVTADYN